MPNPLDQVASWPVTAAVGVASAAGVMETAGPAARPFRWASVTKLLVALAALDAVQRGLLDLDEPAGPPGSTIRHLLSHASGLAFDSDAIQAKPGRRRIYSNRGIEIVATSSPPGPASRSSGCWPPRSACRSAWPPPGSRAPRPGARSARSPT